MADLSACLTDFTSALQAPPFQGDEGGLNFYSIRDSSKYFLTSRVFSKSTQSLL